MVLVMSNQRLNRKIIYCVVSSAGQRKSDKESTSDLQVLLCNPFTLMSDQDRASPYIISTIPSRQATRVNKYINEGILDPILNSPN